MKYIFHIQFTQKEIAALVCELKCTKVVLGETIIQFPLLLTELKLLGRSSLLLLISHII